MKSLLSLVLAAAAWIPAVHAAAPPASSQPAGTAVNQLGLELARVAVATNENACLSPYSIEGALAMTQAGADGVTRREMASVLHLGPDDAAMQASLAALASELRAIADDGRAGRHGHARPGEAPPVIEINVANRLFGARGLKFEAPFLAFVRDTHGAPLEALDFAGAADAARRHINGWVSGQTRDRIKDLLPPGSIGGDTKLVLANALYMKVPWDLPFEPSATKSRPFHVRGGATKAVPTMHRKYPVGYQSGKDRTVLVLPYSDPRLQFVVVLPAAVDGLAAIEASVTPREMASWTQMARHEVDLYLPKFRIESSSISLAAALQSLGMKTAFDKPAGSADFGRMVAGSHHGGLFVSDVFHKTFLALDERGTEAAAATAVVMAASAPPRNPPVVRVDRPFLFAIQHTESGACLFLGRVVDPR